VGQAKTAVGHRPRGKGRPRPPEPGGSVGRTGHVLERLRALCLALPETSEKSSWGHPNFRAGKRTFAAFEHVGGRPSIAFRLDRTEVNRLVRRKQFFATPYGRGLWVSLWADRPVDWILVSDMVERSFRTMAGTRRSAAIRRRPSPIRHGTS
jgi:predicted DNA-binding protein (MmcQ/YjbR family)